MGDKLCGWEALCDASTCSRPCTSLSAPQTNLGLRPEAVVTGAGGAVTGAGPPLLCVMRTVWKAFLACVFLL